MGGGSAPAEYTENDKFILRISGHTPIYKGIKEADYDTPIEVPAAPEISAANAKACGTLLRHNTSSLVEALNSGTIFMLIS